MLQALFVATGGNATSGSTWKHREGWTTAATSSPSNDTDLRPPFVVGTELPAMTEMILGMAMYAIDWSNNGLSGLVPAELFDMESLESIDLSWNHNVTWISQTWPLRSP
jgi:hypothetical protein